MTSGIGRTLAEVFAERGVHRRLSAAVSERPGVADYLVDITRTRHGTRLQAAVAGAGRPRVRRTRQI
ncbi:MULTISPECIES: hypothetical protein [unclassified Frankia]|uniref:hypothetical protein n=1 Tax=unclassified Frankia TaxID=2632575 RepID=UPI002AD3AFC6|nr:MULTISPECIES: hypothetical protein [unclassified Frankia]